MSFLHLDLGLGGAERLVVDAACSLKLRGHSVLVLTSHHDPNHAFEETMPSMGGLISKDIRCAGDWLPRNCCGKRFHLLFAILRMIYIAHKYRNTGQVDVLIIDQVSYVIPFARWLLPRNTPILFYLHFPDKLLVQNRHEASVFKRMYRWVFDSLEEKTTCMADRIVVNSNFTLGVMSTAFPSLRVGSNATVLYPCVDLDQFDRAQVAAPSAQFAALLQDMQGKALVLSINRFERKKNLRLVVDAFSLVHEQHPNARLVITGGYDERVQENVDYCNELKQLVEELELMDSVVFWVNCSQSEKRVLLDRCRVLVYTPADEHFGIVPIEAGAARKPCVCCNSGGPLETIVDGETGMLCEPTALQFAQAIEMFVNDATSGAEMSQRFGRQARARVERMFSRVSFGENLEHICEEMAMQQRATVTRQGRSCLWVSFIVFVALVMALFWEELLGVT